MPAGLKHWAAERTATDHYPLTSRDERDIEPHRWRFGFQAVASLSKPAKSFRRYLTWNINFQQGVTNRQT